MPQPNKPNTFDWIVLLSLLLVTPCAGIFSLAWTWTGHQYLVWHWLRVLIMSLPLLIGGIITTLFPNIVFAWYKRLDNSLANLSGRRNFENIRPITNNTTERSYVITIGIGLTVLGAIWCLAVIKDMITRPECFMHICSLVSGT